MNNLGALGAVVSLALASGWWGAIAVIARALGSQASSTGEQLMLSLLSGLAAIGAIAFLIMAASIRSAADGKAAFELIRIPFLRSMSEEPEQPHR